MMDLHTHTIYSDGIGSVIDNVNMAEIRGLRLLGISDHIHFFTPSKFLKYVNEVRSIGREAEIPVLVGIEANITENGPDVTEDFAKHLDYVIASVHDWFGEGEVYRYIERIKLALMDENVTIIGHFGNVFPWIGYPTEEQIKEVLDVAEEYGKAFEISSRYRVPDLEFVKMCIKRGIKLVFASDAHRPEDVGRVDWSIKVFEKAGGKKEDLLFSEMI
ncbi:MAG: putative hydrolase [Pyrococcus sp.]|nr:putative hydrolase [Pyrococcus sp.]